jgi:hypothetical protein
MLSSHQDPQWANAILGESDAIQMRRHVLVLASEEADDDARTDALEALEEFSESLDNANGALAEAMSESLRVAENAHTNFCRPCSVVGLPDLAAIGGLSAVFTHLAHVSPSVRAAAFSLLGVCLRNNPAFQQQISDLDDPLSPLASWLEAVSLAPPSRGSATRCTDFMRRGLEAIERDASLAVRNKALLAVSGKYFYLCAWPMF